MLKVTFQQWFTKSLESRFGSFYEAAEKKEI